MSKDSSRPSITIKEIARSAQTSTATVSRVLRETDYPVSDELRRRVLEAASRLNYQPNLIGRFLKNSDSIDIGVIIPNISNPFYSVLLLGIEEVLNRNGLTMLLCNSFRDEEKEKRYVNVLRQKQVRGLIIASIARNHEYLDRHIREGLKVVTFDQAVMDIECSKIMIDYEQGSILSMRHLFENGHTEIGFMSAPLTQMNRRLIYSGYLKALAVQNLPVNDDLLMITDSEVERNGEVYEFENGKKLAGQFLKLKRRPTAVLVINDMTAYGLMHALSMQGIRVPDDLSVISFDDIFFSQITNPPLTTVSYSTYEMGQLAAERLLAILNGATTGCANIVLAPKLIQRCSVRRLEPSDHNGERGIE